VSLSSLQSLKVELRNIDTIQPYPKNPRQNDGAVAAVARSIQEFGWRQPVVLDKDGVIVAGHTRWKAAKQLGLTKIPVHVAADLTPEQARSYRIADNATAAISEWDMDLLPIELLELKDLNVDLSLLGFDEDELSRLLKSQCIEGLVDADEIPAPPAEAITQKGDVWRLGRHTLLCGDSGSEVDLDRLLNGQPIHVVNSDPPYGVAVQPRSNNARAVGKSESLPTLTKGKATSKQLRAKDRVIANDNISDDAFDVVLRSWFGNIARALVPGGAFYIWGGYANWSNYCTALKACGLYFSQGIVWVKDLPVLGRKDFMNDCEFAWYGWKEGAGHKFHGPANARNVWHIKKVNPQSMVHLTEKPVELAARAIQFSSKPGENVLDLFGGSGSTLIAAEQLGRCAYLMELDGLYCDIIKDRWERFTGQKADRVAATSNTLNPKPPSTSKRKGKK